MKKNNPAPEGSSVVCPYLIVESIERQMDFFRDVFDAEILEGAKQSDGHYMHGEVRIGDTLIMMGRANEKFPPVPGMNYVYVSNVDDVYRKALDAGAFSLMEPEDRFYGNREGGIKDPQGNTWWIAQFIKKVSTDDIEKAITEMEKK